MPSTSELKASLRRQYRNLRAALPESVRLEAAELLAVTLPAYLVRESGLVIAATTPRRAELDPGLAVKLLQSSGHAVAWISSAPNSDPDKDPLTSGPDGQGEPIPLSEVDLILVPGVAFTSEGDRLGQGGGYFDRLLIRRKPSCLAIGYGYECQRAPSLPVEAHDIRMDQVLFL